MRNIFFNVLVFYGENCLLQELFIDFKKAYDSVKREVSYSILIEFGVFMRLVHLFKMCSNKTHGKVHTG
jgi:hypothetical protein